MARHNNLIEIVSLCNRFLANMTNQAYAHNRKMSYKLKWEKGTAKLQDNEGKVSTHYYTLSMYIIDKTDSLEGRTINLYNNHYPIKGGQSVEHLEESAYQEFLQNGLFSLANVGYSMFVNAEKVNIARAGEIKIDEAVEKLRESAEIPKLII